MSSPIADNLLALGADAVLVLAAERNSITTLQCEMPICVCPLGRTHFASKRGRNYWAPSADRFPLPARHGGVYVPENIRLAHFQCNRLEGTRAGASAIGPREVKIRAGQANKGKPKTAAHRANISRGRTGIKETPKTHCRYGHPFEGTNVYVRPSGKRDCRICNARRQRERNARLRQETKEHAD